MWSGYGYLNSTEIWNNQRVMDYLLGNPVAGQAGLALQPTIVTPSYSCGTASRLFCDPPLEADGWRYTTPADDDAPWYDPAVPESADFAGLFVTEVEGFDSVVDRDFSQRALLGGSLGPLRFKGRTITVTGWLRAATCCAAEYGLRWLQEALIGGSGCADCSMGELVMLKCCPSEPTPDPADFIRYGEQVGLLDGPKVTDRMGTCCASCGCTNLQVQFSIGSQSPYLFSEVDWCAFEETFPLTEEWCGFFDDCGPCPPPAPSTFTPDCGPAPITPPAPFLVDDNCYCDPWCVKRLTCSFVNTTDWNDQTGILEIHAGSADIKNLKLVAYRNARGAQGLSCEDFFADDSWRCATPCSTIEVAQLPTGSKLTIDSRTRVASLQLAGGVNVPGLRYVSGGDGGPFDWLDLSFCASLCVMVTVDCSVAADATISLGYVNKYLASGG